MKQKILIDTDIGDDIDDAFALAFALRLDEIELVGITTVFGDTDKRARIAAKICRLAGVDVPIYAGVGTPIDRDTRKTSCCQYTDDLADKRYAPVATGTAAVDFIADCARRYGEQLTIVGIGPLTNLALAFRAAPDAMRGVGKIVIMGGCFYAPHQEWNIVCDTAAARTVLESNARVYCVGLDVTRELRLDWKEQTYVLNRSEDGLEGYVASLARRWVSSFGRNITLHDPLALYAAVRSDVVFFEKSLVAVETDGRVTKAMTVVIEELPDRALDGTFEDSVCVRAARCGGAVYCARQVHRRTFLSIFMDTLFGVKEENI